VDAGILVVVPDAVFRVRPAGRVGQGRAVEGVGRDRHIVVDLGRQPDRVALFVGPSVVTVQIGGVELGGRVVHPVDDLVGGLDVRAFLVRTGRPGGGAVAVDVRVPFDDAARPLAVAGEGGATDGPDHALGHSV